MSTRNRLQPGDEVIVPALCWSTTVWPLIQHGLVPVIVDIDPVTFNINPEEIERAIGPKTRGIMLVHVYGNPCDMNSIMEICSRRNLLLIEDCCEALGAYYNGTPVGKFGSIGSFSFYFSHHMSTLEGGVCVTESFELAEMIRMLRAHGWVRELREPQDVMEIAVILNALNVRIFSHLRYDGFCPSDLAVVGGQLTALLGHANHFDITLQLENAPGCNISNIAELANFFHTQDAEKQEREFRDLRSQTQRRRSSAPCARAYPLMLAIKLWLLPLHWPRRRAARSPPAPASSSRRSTAACRGWSCSGRAAARVPQPQP